MLKEFDIEIRDKKRTQNLVSDHVSRLIEQKREELPLDDSFPDNKLFVLVQNVWVC